MLGSDVPLVKEADEGLIVMQESHIAQGFDEEARIEQMHNSVIGPACIDIYRHPLGNLLRVKSLAIFMRAAVSRKNTMTSTSKVSMVSVSRLALARRSRGRWY